MLPEREENACFKPMHHSDGEGDGGKRRRVGDDYCRAVASVGESGESDGRGKKKCLFLSEKPFVLSYCRSILERVGMSSIPVDVCWLVDE